MREVLGLLATMIGLAADPLLLIGAGLAGALLRRRGLVVLAAIGAALALELLLVAMTANSPFGPYPFGRVLFLRAVVTVLVALAVHGVAVLVRRRRQAGA